MTGSKSQNKRISIEEVIPLIDLPIGEDTGSLENASSRVVGALQESGFLLIRSPELSLKLQKQAIQAAKLVLTGDTRVGATIKHPTDPKLYIMLESTDEIASKCKSTAVAFDTTGVLDEYWTALERVKRQVLTCIAIGLDLPADYFVKLHQKNNSALRLLHYPAVEDNSNQTSQQKDPPKPTVRCKPHSDYGSVTLLLTDGVPGLEALIGEEWRRVPYVEGALHVNIGSLLHDWTNGKLLATLHRVVDGNREDSSTAAPPRTSLAFFADPDAEVSAILNDSSSNVLPSTTKYKSVADYIQWRSGGSGTQRSGLAFSKEEEERAKGAKSS